VLYLMSYGHHREVLKPGYQALLRDRKVGRGREIRTPDILLPKQARYQTALYPDSFNAGICARPRFSGGRIILTRADSVNVDGGNLRGKKAKPFTGRAARGTIPPSAGQIRAHPSGAA
tara:strand:+ start:146016 stop:146369 length:354 start_codon:yes stop_codon:yes gene_type:complete